MEQVLSLLCLRRVAVHTLFISLFSSAETQVCFALRVQTK